MSQTPMPPTPDLPTINAIVTDPLLALTTPFRCSKVWIFQGHLYEVRKTSITEETGYFSPDNSIAIRAELERLGRVGEDSRTDEAVGTLDSIFAFERAIIVGPITYYVPEFWSNNTGRLELSAWPRQGTDDNN